MKSIQPTHCVAASSLFCRVLVTAEESAYNDFQEIILRVCELNICMCHVWLSFSLSSFDSQVMLSELRTLSDYCTSVLVDITSKVDKCQPIYTTRKLAFSDPFFGRKIFCPKFYGSFGQVWDGFENKWIPSQIRPKFETDFNAMYTVPRFWLKMKSMSILSQSFRWISHGLYIIPTFWFKNEIRLKVWDGFQTDLHYLTIFIQIWNPS